MNDGDMFPAPKTSEVSIEDKISEIERELRMRWHVYPRMVEQGKMNQQDADRKTLVLSAILEDLQRYQQKAAPGA